MESKIVKMANTENKIKIIRYFSLKDNDKVRYICFINHLGRKLDLESINIGEVSTVSDKLIIFRIKNQMQVEKIKDILEKLFTEGTSDDFITYEVDNIDKVDVVSYQVLDKKTYHFNNFFNVKSLEEKQAEEITLSLDLNILKSKKKEASASSNIEQEPKKEGNHFVTIIILILVLAAVAYGVYYYKDSLFKKDDDKTEQTIKTSDQILACAMIYNKTDFKAIKNEEIVLTFSEDKKHLNKNVITEKIKFYTELEYNEHKDLLASNPTDTVIKTDDENLILTLTRTASENTFNHIILDEESNLYDYLNDYYLKLGYSCNGNVKEVKDGTGVDSKTDIKQSLFIYNNGWRIIIEPSAITPNSKKINFKFNVRNLNDSQRNMKAIITIYDSFHQLLKTFEVNRNNIIGNSLTTMEFEMDNLNNEFLPFDIGLVGYYSLSFEAE
ncbi:MAG: hypothetical protein PHO63_00350 [Bacilli bacterium]|nr:hypothetical protein [Bacilli bacterium]MDD4808680.1 hypothetical protein [Bacilli bacterium]